MLDLENPPLVDSHAHVNMTEFDQDREEVLKRSFQSGIAALLCPAEISDPENLRIALDLADRFPNLIAAAGVHPHEARLFQPEFAGKIEQLAARIHAVGEIGLDYHYNYSDPDRQRQVFRIQLELAARIDLPVVVHSRLAADDVRAAVRAAGLTRGGVLHCFTEDWTFARDMLDLGFFISFSGILTYPKASEIRDAARRVPVDRILVETDSPFLAPVPYRGKLKRNEPRYVRETARFLAELRGVEPSELARRTTENFQRLFQFDIPFC